MLSESLYNSVIDGERLKMAHESGFMTEDEVVQWVELEHKVRDCEKCPLHNSCTQKVFGGGNPKAPFLFVGEAPGAAEDIKAQPFVGPDGRFLRKCMGHAGFQKGDVYMTTMVRCRPPNNRAPTDEEVGRCFMNLWYQLEIIKPKLIVPIGQVAMQAITDTRKGLGSKRGEVFSAHGYKIVPVWHPSFVRQSGSDLRHTELVRDLTKAYREVYAV